jgi:transcriptional regulator with XRE-family HTH domain
MTNEIGAYLKQLRGDRSLREIANLSKGEISHNYVRDSENGYTQRGNSFVPSPEKLKVFARIYNVSYNHLMQLAGYTEETPDWATDEDVVKVENLLDEHTQFTLSGETLDEEEAENIRQILRAALWKKLQQKKESGANE